VYENLSDPAVRFREVTWGRPMIAALWFTAGVLAWRGERRRGSQSGAAPERFEFARHWISFACWAAALFEVSKADVHLSDWLRAYAFELRIYRERRWVQQLATVAVGGGGAVIGWLALWRIQSTSRSIVLLCLVAFAACSLARLFSLHQLDQTLAFAVGPVTLGPAAKLALAATAALVFWPRRGPKDHE
jgi:hypothetical protein